MSTISDLIKENGWSSYGLALPRAPEVPSVQAHLGSPWWQSWPTHLQQACAYPGLVYEISTLPGSGATSFALTALMVCRAQQKTAREQKWLLGIELPEYQLNGAALSALGLSHDALVMARPPKEQIPLMTLQAVRSGLFAGIFIDLSDEKILRKWKTPSRRLLLAARDSNTAVWFQTHRTPLRSGPFWSHVKIDVCVTHDMLDIKIKKHNQGSAPWRGSILHPAIWHLSHHKQLFV